jgi:hypothetical protein
MAGCFGDSQRMTATAERPTTLRIGGGAGFSGDRIDPAVELARRGGLDYLVFECLAERTIALAVQARLKDPAAGFDPLLAERMEAVLAPCAENRVRIISNMGAANPRGAARRTAEIASRLGLHGLKIAAVTGDDVLAAAQAANLLLLEGGDDMASLGEAVISANAYVGCDAIVAALAQGADVVLTGRAADPALFLAPLVHEFGWAADDWTRLGRGVAVGHLLECAGQVTGGYHADPGFKEVADLADLGFPIAEVGPNGEAVITKLAGTGGRVTLATCKEQLLYELHDPAAYLTPDVIADFSSIHFSELAPDRIAVHGGGGRRRPDLLKASIGYHDGFIGEGQISYGGPGCVARGRLALAIVVARLKRLEAHILESRFDLIGLDALHPSTDSVAEPPEIRARVTVRASTEAAARAVGREVEALYTNGPAGGGGVSQSVRPVVAMASALIARSAVDAQVSWEVAP